MSKAASPIERAARALCSLDGRPENATMDGKPLWQDYLPEVRAVMAAVREPIDQAKVYLLADAEAWEKGSENAPHREFLMASGKLRRDIANQLDALLAEGQ